MQEELAEEEGRVTLRRGPARDVTFAGREVGVGGGTRWARETRLPHRGLTAFCGNMGDNNTNTYGPVHDYYCYS